jgi:hypothetical protein
MMNPPGPMPPSTFTTWSCAPHTAQEIIDPADGKFDLIVMGSSAAADR